jgi:hypothetical protein
MSHVSSRELRRFITSGRSTEAFEAHVNDCKRCARALSRTAQTSLDRPASALVLIPLEAWLAFAVTALALLLWPQPVRGAPQLILTSTGPSLSAGVPDAGPADGPMPPLLVASYDAGELRD